MTENHGVLICGETVGQNLTGVTAEIINTGRRLCGILGGPLSLFLSGQNIQNAAHEAISFGVDKVYVVFNQRETACRAGIQTVILSADAAYVFF